MTTMARRQRAAELARRQARIEAEKVAAIAEQVLPVMSGVLHQLEREGHHDLRVTLEQLKNAWRKQAYDYVVKLQRSGVPASEPSNLHAIVAAMRTDAAREHVVPTRPSAERLAKVVRLQRRNGARDAG